MDEFSELEAELKRLEPAAPSARLLSRIESDLFRISTVTTTAGVLQRRRRPSKANWFVLSGLGLAAAATILILARVNVNRPEAQPAQTLAATKQATPSLTAGVNPTRTLLPDGVTRVVYGQSNEGLVYPANSNQPVRRVRSRSRETLQWKDPGTGASLRVSYPTEEVELIPVSGQ